MSDFLEDPSVLTKDKLKSALQANNVPMPTGDQRKDVYVQLYLKHLTAQNKKTTDSPDVFSSDEELPPAPVVSNRSRSGRKATRKTDKVRPEEVNVYELTDEGLKDLLLKYGVNAGPIVASTRKVYEKRLQKLLDQGPPETVAPPSDASQTDGSQNGNTDSDQYSDKEEEIIASAPMLVLEPEPEVEPEPIPVVERPIRSRGKIPVTSRTRSGQHKEDKPEEDWPALNVKRKLKTSSRRLDQTVPASDDTENSEMSSSEFFLDTRDRRRTGPVTAGKESRPLYTNKTSKFSSKVDSQKRRSAPVRSFHPGLNEAPPSDKSVPKEPKPSKRSSVSEFDWSETPNRQSSSFQTTVSNVYEDAAKDEFTKNSTDVPSSPVRLSNREPLASLLNTTCVEVDDHGTKDMLRCNYTNRPVALSLETQSVSAVSKLSKNIQPQMNQNKPDPMHHLSSSYESQRDLPSSLYSLRDPASEDSLLSLSIKRKESCGLQETQLKTRQSKLTPYLTSVTPVRRLETIQMESKQTAMVEKVSAIDQTPRTLERDVLKDIFPNENLRTPTGISATCRRPIKGAAGRNLGDSWLDESRLRHTELRETSTSYTVNRSAPYAAAIPLSASKPAAPPAAKTRARRGLPVWVQLLLLSVVAGFLFFVYQAMETNEIGLFKQSGSEDSTSK